MEATGKLFGIFFFFFEVQNKIKKLVAKRNVLVDPIFMFGNEITL